jgi:hypothetical protein
MLEKEFKYYLDNQVELVEKYNNRVIVIRNEEVVKDYDYDDFEKAVFESAKKYELGTFLVQECTEGDKDYTEIFHSRVRYY